MRNSVRFLLGSELRELRDFDPAMTVLQYLRTVERRTGTKEGCAEGDCGACTVVVGDLRDGSIRYRAVNSCIMFLPVLDGKQLLTVEDLKRPDGTFHPVQQAMVDCHGSQCGFCTPGFVMSLYALYQSGQTATRAVIDRALAGNLCRCTGYDSIVAAAGQALERTDPEPPAPGLLQTLASIRPDGLLALSFEGRKFLAPASLDELAALAVEHPEARLLAGGTDIGLWVTKQHRDLPTVIYLANVAELQRIRVAADEIELGGAVPLTDVIPVLADRIPPFAAMMRRFGSDQIRNSGTLGGNIANGSPIGDSMPPLLALGATVSLRCGETAREVHLDDFFVAYQETVLQPGEIVTAVRIPVEPDRLFGAYKISKRPDQDISTLCGAFSIALDGVTVRDARIAYGGMAAIPARAGRCEAALIGREWNLDSVRAAAQFLDDDFAPITDMRGSKEYRGVVARNLLARFFLEWAGEAVDVFAYGGVR